MNVANHAGLAGVSNKCFGRPRHYLVSIFPACLFNRSTTSPKSNRKERFLHFIPAPLG
jgi:hypothetical protein